MMDWKQFTVQIVSSIVWPILVITILLFFKKELVNIIQRLMHLKYKDFELEFEKVNQQAEELKAEELHAKELQKDEAEQRLPPKSLVFTSFEDQVLDIVERVPAAAILLVWSGLETAIASAVARLAKSPKSPSYNIDILSKYSGLSISYVNLLEKMRILRNNVAHQKETMVSINKDQALKYVKIAIDMIQYFDSKGEKNMKTYKNIGGNSGVIAYDYGPNWIQVKFRDESIYEYTYSSAGANNVDSMKRLADSGEGLNAFINTTVRKLYSRRLC